MNKKKLIVVLLSAVFALGSLAFGMVYSKRYNEKIREQAEAQTQLTTKNDNKEKESKETKNVADLFADQDYVYLAQDVSDELIASVKKMVKGQKEDETFVQQAESKWKTLKEVNQLFEGSVLKGANVQNAKLKKDVSTQDLDRVQEIIQNNLSEDAFQTTLLTIIEETRQNNGEVAGESQETQEMTKEIDTAKLDFTQDTNLAYAKEQVGYVVTDSVVVSNFTMEGYQNARAAVDALSESDEKTYLNQQLKYVEEAMTSMGIDF